jgi:hypothetical protein
VSSVPDECDLAGIGLPVIRQGCQSGVT